MEIIWVLIYLTNLLLLSIALGFFTFKQPYLLFIKGLPRFLIGFCMAPYAMGGITLAIMTVFPNTQKWLYILTPTVLSVGLFVNYLPHSIEKLKENGLTLGQSTIFNNIRTIITTISFIICTINALIFSISIILADPFLSFLGSMIEQAYIGTGNLWIRNFIFFIHPLSFYLDFINEKYLIIQIIILSIIFISAITCITSLVLKALLQRNSNSKKNTFLSRDLRKKSPDKIQTIKNLFQPENWTLFCTIVLIISLFSVIAGNITHPIIEADAREYLAKGLLMAQTRSWPMSSDYSGTFDGSLRSDAHGPLFPAYLSQALMTNGNNPLGYPFDYSARAAYQITFIYFILALLALGTCFRPIKEFSFTLILLLQVPFYFAILTNSYRDAFRFIPLILLAMVLMGLSPENLHIRKPHLSTMVFPMVLAACCVYGHILNGFVVVCMTLAWLTWSVLGKSPRLYILLITAVLGIGLLISGIPIIISYLETGSFFGHLFGMSANTMDMYQGMTINSASTGILGLLEKDHYLLSVPGLLCAIIYCRLWFLKSSDRKEISDSFFISLIVIFNLLPLLGFFDTKFFTLSETFKMNYRYMLYWHPFAAICVSIFVWRFFNKAKVQNNIWSKKLGLIILILWSSAAFFISEWGLLANWTENSYSDHLIASMFGPMVKTESLLSGGRKILLNITGDNYYLGNRAISMYTKPTWGAVYNNNEEGIKATLNELNIGAVIFYEHWISTIWVHQPLFQFINNPKNAYVFNQDEYSRIYILK